VNRTSDGRHDRRHDQPPIAIGETLYRNLPYNLDKDFVPVVSTAIAPLFLVVNADAPYRTLADFIQYGRRARKA
jgi:tripartite-type tricarboxylate transporter receptor subunit TctC